MRPLSISVMAVSSGLQGNPAAGLDLVHTVAHDTAQYFERGPDGAVSGESSLDSIVEDCPADFRDRVLTAGAWVGRLALVLWRGAPVGVWPAGAKMDFEAC